MTINFCDACLAVILCTIITIILYIASWFNYEDKENQSIKEANTSNIQGLENNQIIPSGEPNEIINYDLDKQDSTNEYQSSGEIIKEKSDLCRLQDEYFRACVAENDSSDEHISEGYVHIDDQGTLLEYDSPINVDKNKIQRLHLSIRYDDERSQLIVRIIDVQDLTQSEMILTVTLIGLDGHEFEGEKYTRVFVDNTTVNWKEPMKFCITYENLLRQNLYLHLLNKTNPMTSHARKLSIPLTDIDHQNKEINQWFDL